MTSFHRIGGDEAAAIGHAACIESAAYAGLPKPVPGVLDAYECWRIDVDGKPQGAVIFCGNEGHIGVRNAARRRWAGKAFYRFLAERVQERGVLKVKCGNPEALGFLRKLEKRGFLCVT